jgi:hypothetical protein
MRDGQMFAPAATRTQWGWRWLAVFAVVALLGAVSCGSGDGATPAVVDAGGAAEDSADGGKECADCAKDSDCGDGLTCDKPAFVCKTPKQVKVGAPVCDVDCAESDFCQLDGLCSIDGKVCKAKLLAHCIASAACGKEGRCTVDLGKCIVASDGDCQQGDLCKSDGKCTHKDGTCIETADVKCGDGKCNGNETKQTCAKDCGPIGGDPCPCEAGGCGVQAGCPNDCGSCKAPQWCFANKCTDAKCALPNKWPLKVQRVNKLLLLNHKNGCDLDDSGKPNNMLGKLLTVYAGVNEHAFTAIQTQTLNLLLTADGYNAAGKTFSMGLLDASLDSSAGTCNPEHAACKYLVNAHSYDVLAKSTTCPAVAHVANAKVVDNKLSAGGPGNTLNLAVYVVGVPLVAKLQDVTLAGAVSGGSEWQTTSGGMICGAMKMDDLNKAVDSLPASALKGTGFDKKKVKELVSGLFKADLDTDADGKLDAMSAAWAFGTGPGEVLGVK